MKSGMIIVGVLNPGHLVYEMELTGDDGMVGLRLGISNPYL